MTKMKPRHFHGMTMARALSAAAFLLLHGCAAMDVMFPEPVTETQIISMQQAGLPAEEIIEKMRASGAVYRLKASRLAELIAGGVPPEVVDYMQETYLQAVRDEVYNEWELQSDPCNRWEIFGRPR